MTKKKVLICGASGFIGRNLFEHLSPKPAYDVYGTYLHNASLNSQKLHPHLWRADFTDVNSARKLTEGFDCIINAAALTAGLGALDPAEYIPSNNRINANLIESAYKNKVKQFIFLSCSILYPAFDPLPMRELDSDLARIHPKYRIWAYLKIFGEEMCRFYADIGDTRFTVIRHSNVYGPYDKFDARGHVFAATVAKVMNASESEDIIVWGNGQEKRDLIHMSDLARFVELALNYDNRYDIFNVGSGYSITVGELVEKINSFSGRNLSIRYDTSKPTIDADIVLDISKAKEILGWQPEIDIGQGIRQTIDWYLKNRGVKNGR